MAIHLYALPQKTPLSFRWDKPPRHSKQINTRQVTQITYSALYKHLGLLLVTVYSHVSTSPHHIFFHQSYGNAIRTILTLDQFTYILPQAVYCITIPRYYFKRNHFHFLLNFQYCNWRDRLQSGIPSSDVGQSDIPPQTSSGEEWQFHMSTIRAHIGTLTGRSTPPLHQVADQLAWKSAHIGFWICWLQCTMLELCVTSTFWVTMVFLDFWWEGLGIGFWNMIVWVEWDARRTAA